MSNPCCSATNLVLGWATARPQTNCSKAESELDLALKQLQNDPVARKECAPELWVVELIGRRTVKRDTLGCD